MEAASHVYAIALGCNRPHHRHGRPAGVIAAALTRLGCEFGPLVASPVLATPAEGGAGRRFANAAALVDSRLAPPAMLAALKAIEREFGRRRGRRWAPRVLDLDILAWSGGHFSSPALDIPHPRLAERRFALAPLAAIAPDWPVHGALTARHLAHRLARRRPRR